jgi:hypothetical protein
LDKFYTFYELFKKKNIIPHTNLNNNQVTINKIKKNFNHLKGKENTENTEKYGIVLEKKDKKYKVLILNNDPQYIENLAIYFLKNLTQSFSGYCFGTNYKISLHCEPTKNKKKITPKVLCIPKNNSYIKEIELEGNITIGSRLNVGNNNNITVPNNSGQNGGFAGAFALGIFGSLLFNGLVELYYMEDF